MANLDRGILFRQLDRLYRDGTFTAQGDGQLLDRYLSHRDEAAFEALVNLHGPMVLSLCRRFLRDPRDIEDAFQATFLILARKAGSIRKREVLSSWLYGVAYRVAVRARSEVLRRRSVETGELLLDDVARRFDRPRRGRPRPRSGAQPAAREATGRRSFSATSRTARTTRPPPSSGGRWARFAAAWRGDESCSGSGSPAAAAAPATRDAGRTPGFSFRSFTAPVPQPSCEATVQAANRFAPAAMAGTAGLCSFHPSPGRPRPSLKECSPRWFYLKSKCLAPGSFRPGLWRAASVLALALASPRQEPPPRQSQPPPPVAPAPVQARTVTAPAPVLAPPPPATAPPIMHYQAVPGNAPDSSGLGGLEYRLAELGASLTCCSSSVSATSIPRCILRKASLQEHRACPGDRFPRLRPPFRSARSRLPCLHRPRRLKTRQRFLHSQSRDRS